MPYIPLSKRVSEMNHEIILTIPERQMLAAADIYMKALKEIAGKSQRDRLSYFYKNSSRLNVAGFEAPQHDDILALCTFCSYEKALDNHKKLAMKKLLLLAEICKEAHKRNVKADQISVSRYDDLLVIAKRCKEIIEENQ